MKHIILFMEKMKRSLVILGILFCFITNPLTPQDNVKEKWKAKLINDEIRISGYHTSSKG